MDGPLAGSWIGADAPAHRGPRPPLAGYGWALAAVVACTAIGQLWLRGTGEANLIMVFLLGTLVVALRGDRHAAILSAVCSVAAFDFFFVHPYLTLAVSDTGYLFTFLVMGLVGGVISTLTAQLVQQIATAGQREARARALYELSRRLLVSGPPADLLATAATVLSHELTMPVRAWLHTETGDTWRLVMPQTAGDGEPPAAPPTGPGTFPVRVAGTVLGALEVGWQPEGALPPEVAKTLATGANQVAIALEQVRARAAADLAQDQAGTERLRSALLSSVSHDLRTPLTGIVGAASTLLDGAEALEPRIRRDLAQGIVEEADRLNRLVTNLLQATRLDAGSLQLHRTWISLDEAVTPALERLHGVLAEHRVSLDLPADLPLVHADPVLLDLVFQNLLENAACHTPPGTPLHLSAWQEGDRLRVALSDEGPGLPPGDVERIFEKFYSVSTRPGSRGAGLGLAIARGISEAHGGSLTAARRPEGGTRFCLELPIKVAPPTPEEEG